MIQENAVLWYFFKGYTSAALWSSSDDDGEPLDSRFESDEIAPDTMARMEEDCRKFYEANRDHIHCDGAPLDPDFEAPLAYRQAAMAGHDFWLTRNHHGAGFWDGDWPEPHAGILDAAARAFGEIDLYIGDDGLIHA